MEVAARGENSDEKRGENVETEPSVADVVDNLQDDCSHRTLGAVRFIYERRSKLQATPHYEPQEYQARRLLLGSTLKWDQVTIKQLRMARHDLAKVSRIAITSAVE